MRYRARHERADAEGEDERGGDPAQRDRRAHRDHREARTGDLGPLGGALRGEQGELFTLSI